MGIKMKEFLYFIVEVIARIHNRLLGLNDAFEYDFSDKELHFLVIGALGMAMIFVVYPLFKWLAGNHHIMVISWIYVFSGNMEFADIMFGVVGFLAMFAVFSVGRAVYHAVKRGLQNWEDRRAQSE